MLDLKQIESFYPETMRPFKRNLLREYIQYKILEAVYSSGFADGLCFLGGTAIHIAHANPRFSEDLDFDNKGLNKEDFNRLAKIIGKRLKLEGYPAEIDASFKGAYRMFIKLAGILYQAGISRHIEEKLLIQIDAEPQRFTYKPDVFMLNKFDVFTRIDVAPPDLLLAQKIYAIFMRKRALGRDFYDAIYLFGKTRPNFDYLEGKAGIKNMADMKKKLLEKCKALNFKRLADDLRQFLFIPSDAKKVLLFTDYIKKLT